MVRRPSFASAVPTAEPHATMSSSPGSGRVASARPSPGTPGPTDTNSGGPEGLIRSAEITAPGRLEVVALQGPQGRPSDGHVRVRMLAVGICGTDLSLASGSRMPPELPWRLGHEGVGEVVEVGYGAEGWAIGDRVALEPNITCGRCEYCLRGVTSACASRLSAGVLTQPGFLAEVVDHPGEFCHRVPTGTPVERAVCAEPLAVAAAAIRRTELTGGEEVLVLGAGAQGLLATLILVSRGYRPWVSEPDPRRRELAVALGASVFERGQRKRPDVIIDAAGVPEALVGVIDHLAPFAKVTIVGETHDRLGASTFDIVQHQLNVLGSFIYEHPDDMATAVAMLSELPTEAIVGPGLSLNDLPEFFANRRESRPGVKQWVDLRA